MGLVVYQSYAEYRKNKKEEKINLTKSQSNAQKHKCVIAMDMVLQFIHAGKDIMIEEDNIHIEDITLKDFIAKTIEGIPDDQKLLNFMRYIQERIPRDN